MSWWYYASGGEKALIVIGIIAMALLVIIIASPHVKPLQFITTRLGLVQERVVYIAVPVNHTVYVNRTIIEYVNQTVPIYINRTVYVPMPVNETVSQSSFGTCHIYSLVFSNGTIWTLGYWVPAGNLLDFAIQRIPSLYRFQYNGTAGIQIVTPTIFFYVITPHEYPGIGMVTMPVAVDIPYNPQPGWVNIVAMGDMNAKLGLMTSGIKVENDSIVIESIYPSVLPNVVIPMRNITVPVMLIGLVGPYSDPFIAFPCNWTFIVTRMTPQEAARLPAPMSVVFLNETYYIQLGRYNVFPSYALTWGYILWREEVSPLNATSLPWPINWG